MPKIKYKTLPRMRKVELVNVLNGVQRSTLDEILALPNAPRPDANKAYATQEVIDFVAANSHRLASKTDIDRAKLKKLGLECERLSIAISVERGETVSKMMVVPAIAKLWGELHALTRQKFEFELPSRYVGKNAIECSQINIQALDEIEMRFKAGKDL